MYKLNTYPYSFSGKNEYILNKSIDYTSESSTHYRYLNINSYDYIRRLSNNEEVGLTYYEDLSYAEESNQYFIKLEYNKELLKQSVIENINEFNNINFCSKYQEINEKNM